MKTRRTLIKTLAALGSTMFMGAAASQELVVWHDLGENGIRWFNAMSAEFAKVRPGVTVRSISYPTEQWFGRSISALSAAISRSKDWSAAGETPSPDTGRRSTAVTRASGPRGGRGRRRGSSRGSPRCRAGRSRSGSRGRPGGPAA